VTRSGPIDELRALRLGEELGPTTRSPYGQVGLRPGRPYDQVGERFTSRSGWLCHIVGVPFTFFAHQVPVLPLKMAAPDRWDGTALVVGSIMPDLWYVTSGWLYGPAGIELWIDGHQLNSLIPFCILPGLVMVGLIRRVVAPVVSAALPKGGFLRLRDYRLLAFAHHRWWVTVYSLAIGWFSHVFLDAFTHNDGYFVENWSALQTSLLTIGGRNVTIYRLLQYGGHVFGSIAGAYLLLVVSRRKLQWTWHGFATRPADPVVRAPGVAVIRGVLAGGLVLGLAYGALRAGDGLVVSFMALVWVMFGAVVVAGLVGRRYVEPLVPPEPSLPLPVIPGG